MPQPQNSQRQSRANVYVLFAYLALAIVLTYPLVLHFATHVAGDGRDDPALTWNLWWVPYAILHLNSSPIYTDFMFNPIGLNLAFYTLTYLNAFLAIPVQFAFNLVVAANVNLLLSFVLSGFGTYLLVKYLVLSELASPFASGRGAEAQNLHDSHETLRSPVYGNNPEWMITLAAFAAGTIYAFSSNKLLYASLGQFNIASSHWIPFYVLFLLKLTNALAQRRPARVTLFYGFLVGLFLLFQALSEFIFASFLIIFTVVYLLYWLVAKRRTLPAPARLVSPFAIAGVTFVIPMLPILAAMLQDMLAEGDFIQQGLGFADVFSSDVLGFFIPSHLHPLFGGLESHFHFAYTNFAYIGFAVLVLAVLALWQVPQARLWGVLGAVFALVTLGPDLRIDGSAIPAPFLPFNFLLDIPLVKGNRYPGRWSVMVTLCTAVLVGYGLVWAMERVRRRSQAYTLLLPFGFLLLACFEHLSIPLPLSNFQIPSVYDTISADTGDFTVLEIPLAWRNGFRMTGTQDAQMMFEQWYQTRHAHPIIGGNTSRNPELKFQYFTEMPVINSLIAVETGHTLDAAVTARDREEAPQVLRFLGVRYVLWHSPRDPQNRAALDAARAYVEQTWPVSKFYDATDESGETIAYQVNDAETPIESFIRAGDPMVRMHFAEGWGALSSLEWVTRSEAKLFVQRDTPADATLTMRFYVPMASQTMHVLVNGNQIGELTSQQGWNNYEVRAMLDVWREGMNEITLQFDTLMPVSDVREGSFAFGMTSKQSPLAVSPVSLVARSAGSEVGDFAHIYVNGEDRSPNGIGYNVVVVNPQSGAVEASASFNTFASDAESARLAQFIAGIREGRIVAVAVRDEASRYLTADAVAALQSIGAGEDLRGKWRWSHAVIGVKGAPPGSVVEMASETMPAQAVVGVAATEPNVAAAVESIEVK